MNFKELSDEVNILSFGKATDKTDLMKTAVNLALGELYTSRPVLKTVRFALDGQKPILYCKEKTCSPGEYIEFPLNGRAYSVRIHGTCQFMIQRGDEVEMTTVKSGNEAQLFKGIVYPGSKISFWGIYSFSIFDFSVYEKLFSSDAEDIYDGGPTVTVDIKRLHSDFMSFVAPAKDNYGSVIEGCKLYNGKMEIDSAYNGEIVLTYRRLPTLCNGNADAEIDIPDEYRHIFPLLVASYLMIDSVDTTYKYYKELYESGIALMKEKIYEGIDVGYENTNGWA